MKLNSEKKKEKVENLLYQQTLMSVCLQCSVGRLGVSLFLFPHLFSSTQILVNEIAFPNILALCTMLLCSQPLLTGKKEDFPHPFILRSASCLNSYVMCITYKEQCDPGGQQRGGGGDQQNCFHTRVKALYL